MEIALFRFGVVFTSLLTLVKGYDPDEVLAPKIRE
jgi:hypothetical protein